MATGNYGVIRGSDVSPEDVEIIMTYTESRDDTQNFILKNIKGLTEWKNIKFSLTMDINNF